MNSKGLTLAGAGGMLQKGRCQSLGRQAHAPDWMLTGVWRGEGRGKRCLQSVKKKKKITLFQQSTLHAVRRYWGLEK